MNMFDRKDNCKHHQSGATLVEFVVIAPVLLFSLLGMMQAGFVFHAKSNLNYAAFEAARAGTMGNAQLSTIRDAFSTAMTGYYGGGTDKNEIATSRVRAKKDITDESLLIEILSPSVKSFDDYASPRLSTIHNTGARVIPNSNLSANKCPVDRPNCNGSASGQTLSDANILKLRITYGIPQEKQMPLVGRFYTMVLKGLSGIQAEAFPLLTLNDGPRSPIHQDTFIQGLLTDNRIPVIVHTAMRMQSDAIEDGNAEGGPGNNGTPTDPGTVEPVYPGGGSGDGGNPNHGGGEDTSCEPQIASGGSSSNQSSLPSPPMTDILTQG